MCTGTRAKTVIGCIAILVASSLPLVRRTPSAFAHSIPEWRDDATVRIGVLGLFHAKEMHLSATASQVLLVTAGEQTLILGKSSSPDSATIHASAGGILLAGGGRTIRASRAIVAGRDGKSADFVLSIPGRISRHYRGTLEITPSESHLVAIVTMDREVAVASVVAAESDPDAPAEALKAQAVATRSYLASGRGRHLEFDFCDTTHCQFLRQPPAMDSAAARAAEATRGLVLAYDAHPIRAMYTRSCSGLTHTPQQLGLPSAAYPYYSTDCLYCRSHPQHWSSQIPPADATILRPFDESSRLRIDRALGWSTVPSNDFRATKQDDHVVLQGTGYGHGIGLCQAGAKAMAREGATFREILLHYYSNTSLLDVRDTSRQAHAPSPYSFSTLLRVDRESSVTYTRHK
jgi:stage II sporulation protein D